MRKVEIGDILDIAQYEKARGEVRRRVIELKQRRRVPVGPMITFVFENHDTVLFQIQEMMRAERMVEDAAIRHEIETYNQLLPEPGGLAATMLIELRDAGRIREEMARLHGVNTGEVTSLEVGGERIPGIFAAGQSDDRRTSAVQYVRFALSEAQRESFAGGRGAAELVIDHPHYRYRAPIEGEVRAELARDLAG